MFGNAEQRTLHGSTELLIWPIPYVNSPPKIDETLFPANQIPCLEACLDRLYQSPVRRDRPGLIVLSKIPSRTRRDMRPAKFDVAPWHARIMAHIMLYSSL